MVSEPLNQAQAGYMLQLLNLHLSNTTDARLHQHMECWMEDVELTLAPKHQGHGMDIGFMRYNAVFSFERFPFKKQSPAVVMANVMAWLDDHDEYFEKFELAKPSFDIEPESDDTVVMTIEVELMERLSVVEAPDGEIHWRNKRWTNAPYDVWYAENIAIYSKTNPPSLVTPDDQN
ncbi:phage tail protein [Vibrio sp. Of7-15]|uniref:phage tail protein n=1 Tax=Vibrio sp. Of7-15 TaxID=2724879 RepID=UPI001EF3C2E2|nr:phage tail protein [Vibrio sp. Of7-15]MCG7499368.1 phage tail protein [Vibrio sp. Of7-15]